MRIFRPMVLYLNHFSNYSLYASIIGTNILFLKIVIICLVILLVFYSISNHPICLSTNIFFLIFEVLKFDLFDYSNKIPNLQVDNAIQCVSHSHTIFIVTINGFRENSN